MSTITITESEYNRLLNVEQAGKELLSTIHTDSLSRISNRVWASAEKLTELIYPEEMAAILKERAERLDYVI